MKSVYFFRVLLLFVFVFLLVGAAQAANFTVNNNADTSDVAAGNGICADTNGNCTLRAAVQEANALVGDDAIGFAASLTNATITLTMGVEISINGTNGMLQINGLGADKLTISGNNASHIFSTISGTEATVTIKNVTLTGGNGGGNNSGGAILVNGGTLVLDGVYVTGNTMTFNGGGVFFSGGTNHQIINSTISANSALNCGGGIAINSGNLTVTNSTISGNTVTANFGGGICNFGTMTLRNVTVTGNSASGGGGGIFINLGALNLGNTIVASNTGGNNRPDFYFVADSITTVGNNLIGDNTTVTTQFPTGNPNANNDIVGTSGSPINPLLAPLANNGGTTLTHALMTGSPAIDQGKSFGSTTDQRGFTRPADNLSINNAPGGDGADIGAFEVQLATAAAVSIGGRVFNNRGRGIFRAVVTLTDMNGETRTAITNPFGYYRFASVAAGETYIFTATHKRYRFAPQVISVAEELTELNFTAEP